MIAADTGRPLKGARVFVRGGPVPIQFPQRPVTKTAVTDDNGRFTIVNLPRGKYSVSAAKTGYVTMEAGQRRPLRFGIPIELGDGQAITNIDLRLPRGGVITGRIRDEGGEPLERATVRVMRFQYLPGGRRLVPAQSSQTDDRGEYRVFGLPPGEYVVSAVTSGFERYVQAGTGYTLPTGPDEPSNYAPTYYPGVTSIAEAARVAVGAGQEQTGIDFPLLLVPTVRVRGVIVGSNADALGRAQVRLIPEEATGAQWTTSHTAPIAPDSTFTIDMVPPGRYVAVATVGSPADRLYAVQGLTLSDDVDGLALTLVPGAAISGVIRFEGRSGSMATEMSTIGIGLVPIDALSFGAGGAGTTRTESDGTFRAAGVQPGRQVLRISPPRGWTVKSATLEGRDITEEILDVKAGQTITGVEVVLSDRGAQIAGAVKAEADVTGSTVIIFPADSQRWAPHSHRIRIAQVDREGRYAIEGLPAGDYLISAVEDVEPGEWFDPGFLQLIAGAAVRVDLTEGERRSQDLKPTPIP